VVPSGASGCLVTFARILFLLMSLPGARELQKLHEIADELHEVFDERGYRVEVALDADPAFGSGFSRSHLERDLALGVIEVAASQAGGPGFMHVNGAGRELVGEHHRYRLLRGKRDAEGELVVVPSSETAFADEEASLLPREHWVLCWLIGDAGTLEDVVAAAVVGTSSGKPGRLVLGPNTTKLGSSAV
jgi:hypothetical protein